MVSRNKFLTNLEKLPPGDGKVMDKEKLAAYRETDGRLHVYSAICTHLGCTVTWNQLEKSFDCPCHGSRFSALSGNVVNGPANTSLQTNE